MTRLYKPDYLERAIFSVLKEISTETIAYANQQQHELTPPYCTLAVESRIKQGQDVVFAVLEDGTQVYHGDRRGFVTLIVVGDECGERADNIVNALSRIEAVLASRKHGPVMHNPTPVTLGPIITEGEQVEQAVAIDIQYRVRVIHFETAGLIEYVCANYQIFDAGNKEIARDAIVEALQGGTLPPDRVFAVIIDEPPADQLKVGNTIPEPVRWKPESMHILSVDLQYDVARMSVDTVDGQLQWTFLKAGPLDVVYRLHNTDGTWIEDQRTLQITD